MEALSGSNCSKWTVYEMRKKQIMLPFLGITGMFLTAACRLNDYLKILDFFSK